MKLDESTYVPAATHVVVDAQATDWSQTLLPPAGSGAVIGVHLARNPVRSSPLLSLDGPMYLPTATHDVATGQATDSRVTFAEVTAAEPGPALTRSGGFVAIHLVPDPVRSNPCVSPDESAYVPTPTQEFVEAQATDKGVTSGCLPTSAGTGALAAFHVLPDPVTIRPSVSLDETLYQPTPVQEIVDAQVTAPMTLGGGAGAAVAVHAPPDPVSITAWGLPEESAYVPTATHEAADPQVTDLMRALLVVWTPGGSGTVVAVQEVPV